MNECGEKLKRRAIQILEALPSSPPWLCPRRRMVKPTPSIPTTLRRDTKSTMVQQPRQHLILTCHISQSHISAT